MPFVILNAVKNLLQLIGNENAWRRRFFAHAQNDNLI
jgi:hypothetical protein